MNEMCHQLSVKTHKNDIALRERTAVIQVDNRSCRND